MKSIVDLVSLITMTVGECNLFNGTASLHEALCDVSPEFKQSDYPIQGYTSAAVYCALLNRQRGLIKDVQPTNTMYDTKINIDQFNPHDFEYWYCFVDPMTMDADIINAFDELLVSFNVGDMIRDLDGASLAIAVKQFLLNDQLISIHDVVEIQPRRTSAEDEMDL